MTHQLNAEKKYSGGCHCGEVRFEVELMLKDALACNCSICTKRGTLLAFAPATKFRLIKGENVLSEYLFNTKQIHHNFCSRCGVAPFSAGKMPDGTPMRSINIRCLDGIDLGKIPVQHYDGKDK